MVPTPTLPSLSPPEVAVHPDAAPPDAGTLGVNPGEAPDASRTSAPLELAGPSGVLHVWLGGARDQDALEADVRVVSESGLSRAATAVALGEVARRHRLEVRIFPRVDERGRLLLVLFGRRVHASRL